MMTQRARFLLFAPAAAAPIDPGAAPALATARMLAAVSCDDCIATLSVSNLTRRRMVIAAEIQAWTMEAGMDVLAPSRDVLASPDVFDLPPHGERTVRLAIRRADAERERAYKVMLREPQQRFYPGAPFHYTTQLAVPLFVTPVGARSGLRLEPDPDDPTAVRLANHGAAHAAISAVEAVGRAAIRAPRFLLSGAAILLRAPAEASAVRVRAYDINGAMFEHIAHLGPQEAMAATR